MHLIQYVRIQTVWRLPSDSWVDWSHLATADTCTITDIGESDVSLFAPAGAPGVLDKEVWGSVVRSVSDGEDTVVKVGSACGVVEDSTAVHLPGHLVGFDGD